MNNAKPWRDYQGKTDGTGKCDNTRPAHGHTAKEPCNMATKTLMGRYSGRGGMVTNAANDSPFEPLAMSDPAFIEWAIRVGLRLHNKAPGAPADAIERAIVAEGTPSPEWAQALVFMMTLAQANWRNTPRV